MEYKCVLSKGEFKERVNEKSTSTTSNSFNIKLIIIIEIGGQFCV